MHGFDTRCSITWLIGLSQAESDDYFQNGKFPYGDSQRDLTSNESEVTVCLFVCFVACNQLPLVVLLKKY